MARRVFVSFLGTSDYVPTHYQFKDGHTHELVRFVQEAIIARHCMNWRDSDKIYIFYTNESNKRNWDDNGIMEGSIGLETRLSMMNLSAQVEGIKIPEGFDEDQIWDIFGTVYNVLEEGDEVYFDATHAFRSIPLFCSTLFNYAKFTKNVTLKSIEYGAFEKLGTAKEVREMPDDNRIAPIIDLSSMTRLQRYTEVASGLETFGRVNKSEIKRIKKEYKEDQAGKNLSSICKSLIDFDNYIATNRILSLMQGKFYLKYHNAFAKLKEDATPSHAPLLEILGKMEQSLSSYSFKSDKNISNIETTIDWAIKYEMLPLAYTLAREYVPLRVSFKYEELNPLKDDPEGYINYKEMISKLCGMSDNSLERARKQWGKGTVSNKDSKEPNDLLILHHDIAEELLKTDVVKKLREGRKYFLLSNSRNDINHGFGKKDYDYFKNQFTKYFNPCKEVLDTCEEELFLEKYMTEHSNLLDALLERIDKENETLNENDDNLE